MKEYVKIHWNIVSMHNIYINNSNPGYANFFRIPLRFLYAVMAGNLALFNPGAGKRKSSNGHP